MGLQARGLIPTLGRQRSFNKALEGAANLAPDTPTGPAPGSARGTGHSRTRSVELGVDVDSLVLQAGGVEELRDAARPTSRSSHRRTQSDMPCQGLC